MTTDEALQLRGIELWLGTEFTVTTIEPVVGLTLGRGNNCVSLQLLTVAVVAVKSDSALFLWLAWKSQPGNRDL